MVRQTVHGKASWSVFLDPCVVAYVLLVRADKNTDELSAKNLLDEYNSTAEVVWNAYTEASWAYNTNINEANKQNMVRDEFL